MNFLFHNQSNNVKTNFNYSFMILINSISIIKRKYLKNYKYKWFYVIYRDQRLIKKKKKYLNNNLIITNIKIKIKIRESVLYISFAYINI